jgi:hypothetical protein
MKTDITIKRFNVLNSNEAYEKLMKYFDSTKWIKKGENVFLKRKTGLYYSITRSMSNYILIDTWSVGGFGIIYSEKLQFKGMLNSGYKGINRNEFIKYLLDNNLEFNEDYTTKKGYSESLLLATQFIFSIIIVILMFIICPIKSK